MRKLSITRRPFYQGVLLVAAGEPERAEPSRKDDRGGWAGRTHAGHQVGSPSFMIALQQQDQDDNKHRHYDVNDAKGDQGEAPTEVSEVGLVELVRLPQAQEVDYRFD